MSYVVQTSQCKRTWWALHDSLLKHNWPLILVASSYDLSIFLSGRNGNTHDFYWVKLCGNRSLDYIISTDGLIIFFEKIIHRSSFLYFAFFNIAFFRYIFWPYFPITLTCKPVFSRGTPENSYRHYNVVLSIRCSVDRIKNLWDVFMYTHKTQQHAKIRSPYCDKHLVNSLFKIIIRLFS